MDYSKESVPGSRRPPRTSAAIESRLWHAVPPPPRRSGAPSPRRSAPAPRDFGHLKSNIQQRPPVPLAFAGRTLLELQPCCVFLPSDSLPSPSTLVSGDIPGTVRSWYHGQNLMPGTLVLCLPQVSVLSAGHKYMEPLQELPFVVAKPILEEGTEAVRRAGL
ncbi:Vacuolar protein sorting-associated protein 13B [Liparis tanakae]|uniref:Vacuolar protein sorting-associated protein 13B n=1 Tax=Liparis tanakae TaxID=230148 RepID=A0A4Z2FA49_9TELE|nr:Vacuolar protein sorting-associated protein 13B [Liparis tanakae]